MNFIIRLYAWGIIADLLFHLYAKIMYSFGFEERKTYQANLNKVGLSWDPRVYPVSEFRHTKLRFWGITFLDLLGSLLSWYQVLYRIHNIMKVREVNAMLTKEEKQAAFVLRKNPTLSKEEVIEKLKTLDPSLIVREPGAIVISKEVDSKEFSHLFTEILLNENGREVFIPLLEANGWIVTSREMAMLKYVVGEVDRDSLLRTLNERRDNAVDYQEADILNRQIRILQSIFGKEKAK